MADAIISAWHRFVELNYNDHQLLGWHMALYGREPWHNSLTPTPVEGVSNLAFEKLEDFMANCIASFYGANPVTKPQQLLFADEATQPNPIPDTWESLSDNEEEETQATAQTNKRAGRKPENIDTLPKMQQKAVELKKIMGNKSLPLTVTTTNLCDEVNQCITDFMAQWATDRKCLQVPHGTMVGRFLWDVCGFTAEGITWRTWCTHVAPEIPNYTKKYKE